ncbi:MAG: HAMP domain-containing protein, partial [Nitrospirae bacterium]|nr:HAMP domain-containing protein [Nitrospirota bacterium]
MNIQKKLTWGAVLMGLVPVAIAVALTGWSANQGATDALRQQAEQRLIAMRDVSKAQIEHYFGTIRGQVRTLSNDKMIVDAAKGLTKAFHAYPADKGLGEAEIAALRADLGGYYKNDFGGEYQTRNGGAAPNMGAVLTQIGTEAVALQNTFINANPNPLGSKHRLDDPKDGSLYARIHNMYHPHIRQFLEEFGYYDIFLVEPETGDVVYSVFKELDFATSLINGPYAQTGLGQAFREANAATGQDAVAITDFAPYKPSYEDQAGFIASPIYDNGAKVGILIFQMPIDRINAVMTHNKKWADVGLGASGETYLVGADHKARSISRFLAEDPDGYAAALKAGGTSQTVIDAIRTKGSNIGLQDLVTEGTQAAVSGQTGFGIFPDYRGVPVLSAYAPLAIPGLNWAIMSEIDVEEAFAAANELTRAIIQWGVGVSLAILLLAAALGRWFALGITRPLLRSVDVMRDIAEGEGDLTRRLDDAGNDELADFAGAFNRFADRLSGIVRQAQVSAQGVAAGAGEIKDGNVDLSQRTEEQAASLEETASSMEQMTANVRQSADNAAKANQMAVGARSQAEHGGRVVADA